MGTGRPGPALSHFSDSAVGVNSRQPAAEPVPWVSSLGLRPASCSALGYSRSRAGWEGWSFLQGSPGLNGRSMPVSPAEMGVPSPFLERQFLQCDLRHQCSSFSWTKMTATADRAQGTQLAAYSSARQSRYLHKPTSHDSLIFLFCCRRHTSFPHKNAIMWTSNQFTIVKTNTETFKKSSWLYFLAC